MSKKLLKNPPKHIWAIVGMPPRTYVTKLPTCIKYNGAKVMDITYDEPVYKGISIIHELEWNASTKLGALNKELDKLTTYLEEDKEVENIVYKNENIVYAKVRVTVIKAEIKAEARNNGHMESA